MQTLFVNLTRFGDLLQMQPAISARKRHGDMVGLACLENFANAADLLRDVDLVRPLPGARFLARMDHDWREALGEVWTWTRETMQGFAPTTVVNLTANLGVRLLTRLMVLQSGPDRAPALSGFGIDPHGYGLSANAWSAFLLASTRVRGCSPFNLVDLFWEAAEAGEGPRANVLARPSDTELADAAALLAAHTPDTAGAEAGRTGYVALQLGASEERRRWPVAHFAALGDRLWRENGLCPVLLGSPGEQHLAERYAEHSTEPFAVLTGRTSLPQLAAVLRHCELLVSNDTGTMHLAAGLDVPVAAIFLATAQPWDTGPYRENCLSLEPDLPCHPCQFGTTCDRDHACRRAVRPETVGGLVQAFLKTGAWAGGSHRNDMQGARAWVSRFDAHGFMDLGSLSGHEHAPRTAWVRLQRHFLLPFLSGGPCAAAPDVDPALLDPALRAEAAATLDTACTLLELLHARGMALAANPMPVTRTKFLDSWQQIQALWESDTRFNALGYLWMYAAQEHGNGLEAALDVAAGYHDLARSWSAALKDVAR